MTNVVGRNVIWNLLGTIFPMLAGVLAMPILLHAIGGAGLGVFSLALGLIGFSGLLDFGLGRGLTQIVASESGRGRPEKELATVVRNTLVALAVVGAVAAIVLWVSAPYLTEKLFRLRGGLEIESTIGLRWIALSLPLALPAAGAVGGVEGLQKFRLVNSMRAPIGVALFLVPAFVGWLTRDVGDAIAGLATVRVVAALIWLFAIAKLFPLFERQADSDLRMSSLFRFSGWLTVSNIVGPLMVYADRFYLASLYPPAAVAHYSVPYDATFRATVLPGSAMNAVFPALAHHADRPETGHALITAAGRLLSVFWFPPMVVGVLFSPELLALWLGSDFARQSTAILKCLLIGIFFNGYAYVPYAVLHARARADITAKLHLFELPLYVGALVLAVSMFGVLGAAIAWSGRVILDAVLLFFCARRIVPESAKPLSNMMTLGATCAVFLIAVAGLENLGARVLVLLFVLSGATFAALRLRARMRSATSDRRLYGKK